MQKFRPLVYLLLLSGLGGSVSTFTKLALRYIPPFSFIFVRLAVGAVVAYIAMQLVGRRMTWQKFKLFAFVATFWWLNALLFPLGLTKTDATTAQFIRISAPILTAIIAGIMLEKKLNNWQWLGISVAAVGVGIVTFDGGGLSLGAANMIGNIIIFLANLVFAFYAVASKLPKFKGVHPYEMVFVAAVSGAIATLPIAAWEYPSHPWLMHTSLGAWLFMLVACVTISLFYCGFQVLVRKFGPAYATLDLYLLPGFVVIWAGALLGERPSPASIFGAVVALAGVWIVTKYATKKEKTAEAEVAE